MITQLPLKTFLSGFILITMGHGMEVPTLDNLSMSLQNLYFNSKDELKKLELYIENHKTIESIKKK